MFFVSKYNAFTLNALKEKYAYRFKAIMWSLSMLFNMLVQYYLWKAVYNETNGSFMGVSQENYLAYISFGVVFYNITSCMENMNMAEDIKSGNIAMNLSKPINYKMMVFFRHVGTKLGEAIGLIPLILVAFLLTNNTIITSDMNAFLLSTILAFLLMFTFSYIVGLVTFWTTNYWGVQFFTNSIMGLFSGQLVSIGFFVEIGKGIENINSNWSFFQKPIVTLFFNVLGKTAYCLPFQGMYYTPMSILSGIINEPHDIAVHIILQMFWLIVLNIISCILWKKAQNKIAIYGG